MKATVSKNEPKHGQQFIAIWEYNGSIWSRTVKRNHNGDLMEYCFERDCWDNSTLLIDAEFTYIFEKKTEGVDIEI